MPQVWSRLFLWPKWADLWVWLTFQPSSESDTSTAFLLVLSHGCGTVSLREDLILLRGRETICTSFACVVYLRFIGKTTNLFIFLQFYDQTVTLDHLLGTWKHLNTFDASLFQHQNSSHSVSEFNIRSLTIVCQLLICRHLTRNNSSDKQKRDITPAEYLFWKYRCSRKYWQLSCENKSKSILYSTSDLNRKLKLNIPYKQPNLLRGRAPTR